MKAAIALAALVLLALPAVADAAGKRRHHRPAVQTAVQSSPHIACTETGCGPVPFGCGKRPGDPGSRTSSRYDEVVCPSAVPSRMR